ncbi:MAG: hypothetical protein F4Y57_15545, partial [Acidobacteria bacterium]|nr:hypothetical protein [Acidobacteriota bacterium]
MRRLAATLVLILLYGALLEAASAQTTEAPAITSAGPFEVNEGTTAVATLVADDDDTTADNLTWTRTGGADSASFTLSTAGVLAFVAAKDYEVPDDADGDGSYEVTVQVSDGVNTDSADLVVTLVNVIELIDITGPAGPTIGENNFGRVATYSASSDADRSGISWSLSGADAADFSIDAPPGALRFAIAPASPNRFKQAADYENPDDGGTDNTYNVTVTASVTDGGSKTLDVAVTVTDVDEAGAITLSATQPRVGTALTATLSDPDVVTAGTTSWQWERNNGREGWLAISGATAATYTPTAADGDRYLRVKATYTDGFGAGKSAETTATRVVIAHRLNSLTFHGLTGVTNDSRASYPAFSSDTLHYAARCSETVEMTVVSANSGTRIAVNGVQRTSGERFSVSGLGSETEIRIVLSGAAGGSTTYTVHCLDRASFPRLTTTTSAGASDELWLFQTKWEPPETGALIAMDHNGVPRWHRIIDDELLAYFQAHPDASSPFGYYSYAKRGSSFDTTGYEIVILDKYFSLVQGDIHIRSPFNTTDFHDQYVLPNGNAVIMAYSRHARDVRFMNRMYPTMTDEDGGTLAASEPMRDSAIQVQTRNGGTVFNWSSWDHMAMTDCVYANNQLRWEYAHINSLSYHDGDIIAGFRHCSKILRIDLETGRVVWRAGPSVNSRADWAAGRLLQPNRGPAPLEFVNDPRNGFSGQHSGEITRDGTLLVYDNATHCTLPGDALVREGGRGLAECGERTRGVEYAFDLDNHELIFLREYRMPGETQGGWGGHAIPLPNGNWIISWSQQRALPATAVEVNPRTGAQVVSLDLANIVGTRNVGTRYPTRVSSVTPVALATAIEDLEATVVSHPGFHGGAGATESPSVVVAFNRPIVDPTAGSPSVVVSGATVASVAAHEQAGAPANAYRFTLTPGGDGRITFSLATGKTCDSDGICTADGATLSKAPAAIQILGPGTVSFGSAAYRVSEGGSVNVQVRLSAAHQGSEPVVVPVALGTASTATADEYDYAASVSFASGETVKSVTLSAANDTLVEGDESVVLEFGTLPTGISAGTQATTTVTLTDTDRATISFSPGRSQVAEGGSTDLTFAITNGVTFQADQEITLSVSGSASDDDYTLSEQLTLSAGETSASTSLSVTDDAALETAETVTVRATIGAASTLIGTRTVTIPPSDVPNVPTVSIVSGADAAEGAAATFTLTRTESTSRPLSSALTVAIQVGVTDVQLSGSAPSR